MGQPTYTPDPEKVLARIIKAELGIVVAPEALRIFIRANWSRVSSLAHDIHQQPRREGIE